MLQTDGSVCPSSKADVEANPCIVRLSCDGEGKLQYRRARTQTAKKSL
jgi:hypothetical protein